MSRVRHRSINTACGNSYVRKMFAMHVIVIKAYFLCRIVGDYILYLDLTYFLSQASYVAGIDTVTVHLEGIVPHFSH